MPRIDRASRVIPAPISVVYAALIDPDALAVWVPPGDMTGKVERCDPRPGGSYRMVLTYPDGSPSRGKTTVDTDVVEAHYTELVPNERVVFTAGFVSDDPAYEHAMTVSWEVTETDDGTRVVFTAEHVPDAVSEEDHAAGMHTSLEKLSAYLTA